MAKALQGKKDVVPRQTEFEARLVEKVESRQTHLQNFH